MSKPSAPVQLTAPTPETLRALPLAGVLAFVLSGANGAGPLVAVQVLSRLVGLLARILGGKAVATARDASDAAAMAHRCGFALDVLSTGEPAPEHITGEMVARVALAIGADERAAGEVEGCPFPSRTEVELVSIAKDPDYCDVLASLANDPGQLVELRDGPERSRGVLGEAADVLLGLSIEDRRLREERTAAIADPAFLRDLAAQMEALARGALVRRLTASIAKAT